MTQDRSELERRGEITAAMQLFDAREMAAVHRAVLSLLAGLDSSQVSAQLVANVTRNLSADFGYLLTPRPEADGGREVAALRGFEQPRRERDELAERVFASGDSILATSGDDRGRSLVGDAPAPASLLYVPLTAQRGVVGVLCVGSFEKTLGVKSLRMASLLASPAALALESARLYEASKLMERRLRLLTDLQRVLGGTDLDSAFPKLGGTLNAAMPYDLALLLRYDSSRKEYAVTHAWSPSVTGSAGRWVGRQLDASRSLHARAAASPLTVIDDLERGAAGVERAWLTGIGLRSGVVLPLATFEETLGAFSLWSGRVAGFDASQREFIAGLGQPLTLAMRNHRLFTQVERAKREWESTFDAMDEAVWITDSAQRVRRFNAAFRRATGLDNNEIVGASAPALLGVDPFDLELRSGEEEHTGRFRRTLNGTRLGRTVEIVATRLATGDFKGGMVFVARDVTEARLLAARVQQANRLAGLGQLAAAVAHEVNNPLAYIAANLHRIREGAARGADDQSTLVEESLEGVERVTRIVETLRIYAGGEQRRSRFSLNDLLDFCLTLTLASLRERAQVTKRFEPVPDFEGDQHRMSQVLVNTLLAAARSIPPGGADRHELVVRTGHDAHGWTLSFEVFENGSPRPLARDGLFPQPQGGVDDAFEAGLALEQDFAIVREMGGEIEAVGDPEPSRLTLTFPKQERSSGRLSSASHTLPGLHALRGRVLIVDDEPFVRRALRRVLAAKHDVELARDAAQALEILEETDAAFDVILCDVVMPGMSGLELVEEVERRWPELAERVIFVTGGVFGSDADEKLRRRPNLVLRKPVQPQELNDAVERLLASALGRLE